METGCGLCTAAPLRPPVDRLRERVFPIEPNEGGAEWPNLRLSSPISALRGTLHRADIPWSSHPGEGRSASAQREYRFFNSLTLKVDEKTMSYQGKKNIPKITVSNESYICFTGCGNFDAWLLRITAQSDSLPFYSAAAMDPKHSQNTLPPWL